MEARRYILVKTNSSLGLERARRRSESSDGPGGPCQSIWNVPLRQQELSEDETGFTFFKFLKRFYLFIFRERGREGERKGEKHQCVVASCMPLTGDLACNLARNPGMCPDWELNQRPLGSQACTQSTEPHQSGLSK